MKGKFYEIINFGRKPSVARDIAEAMNIKGKRNGYIENEKYVVTWALGHLVTNAQPEHYDKAYKGMET